MHRRSAITCPPCYTAQSSADELVLASNADCATDGPLRGRYSSILTRRLDSLWSTGPPVTLQRQHRFAKPARALGAAWSTLPPGLLCSLLAMVLAAPASPAVQQRVAISEVAACPSCRVVAERMATLGGPTVPTRIAWPPAGTRDHRGTYYLPSWNGEAVLQFDANGHFIGTIGRRGDGPGEYRGAHIVLTGRADSILVLDQVTRRITVLDPRGTFARALPNHVISFAATLTGSGSLVISGPIHTRDRAGYPLHRIADDGSGQVLSFGPDMAVLDPAHPSFSRRILGSRGNGLWAARQDRYDIEQWTENGDLLRVLVRHAPWFPVRNSEVTGPLLESRPDPWLTGLWADDAGLLWVALIVPVPSYRDIQRNLKHELKGRYPGLTELLRLYRTRIDVIDPRTGELITHGFIPDPVHWVAAPGLVLAYRTDPDEGDLVDVWKVAIASGHAPVTNKHRRSTCTAVCYSSRPCLASPPSQPAPRCRPSALPALPAVTALR